MAIRSERVTPVRKKAFLLSILENLEQHHDLIEPEVQKTLWEIQQDIRQIPAETFSLQTNGVVIAPAHEQAGDPDAPLFRLTEVMKHLTSAAERHQDDRPELQSAVHQLEGLLGTTEDYFPE